MEEAIVPKSITRPTDEKINVFDEDVFATAKNWPGRGNLFGYERGRLSTLPCF